MIKSIEVVPVSDEQYIAILSRDFPDLAVDSLEHLGSGWDSAAMLVNDELVFRFPRHLFESPDQAEEDKTKKELNILGKLKDKVPFAIPEPLYVPDNKAYFGYKLLPGILWSEASTEATSTDDFLRNWVETREKISAAISPSEAAKLGVKNYGGDKNIEYSKKYLKQHGIDPRTKTLIEQAISKVENRLPPQSSWVLIHQDLQPKNCLLDPETNKITGVIDFGDTEIAPVEADYAFWGKWHDDTPQRLARIQTQRGYPLDLELVIAMQLLYFASDFVELSERGFTASAQGKAAHLDWYGQNWGEL